MLENETLIKGIAIGVSVVLPLLGIAVAQWHSWKGWSNFWQMMYKDSEAQNARLFNALKSEEASSEYFRSKLEHTINMYKPIKIKDRSDV